MVNLCLNCGKYLFDKQDVNTFKRMTIREYVNGVVRIHRKTNQSVEEIAEQTDIKIYWLVNKAECELCGAPHSIFSHPDYLSVYKILYFFSGASEPSEKDAKFIEHFKRNFFAR